MSTSGDPLAAFRPSWGQLALAALAVAALFFYAPVVEALLPRLGVRPVAAGLLLLLVAGLLAGRLDAPAELPVRLPRGVRLGFVVPLALAGVTADPRFLRLVPALIHLWLASVFALSLRDPASLVERVAGILQPRAPDFIRPYCRAVTALWAGLFFANALTIAVLVFAAAPETAFAFSSYGVWLLVGGVSVVEYCVRKAWFRHYEPTGLDRLWARLLPAANTATGRRSHAYIEARKAEMRDAGITPPGEERAT